MARHFMNVGKADRVLRLLLGILLVMLSFYLAGLWRPVLVAGGVIALLTAAIGFCPLYSLLGIRSGKGRKA